MKVHGACHCRQITYEAEIDPATVSICHCTDCQVLSGAPYRVSVPALPGTFRLLTGQPATYVKTADSGARRRHSFCSNCGAPVSAGADTDQPPTQMLRVGGLAERARLAPMRRIWCRSALPWSEAIGEVPGVAGQTA
ncbi:MAG: GFA family protein [Lautropia sp.]